MVNKDAIKKLKSIRPHRAHIWELAWSPTFDILATCSGDWTVGVIEYPSTEVIYTLKSHSSPVTAISWSPDGNKIVSTSRDGFIAVSDISIGGLISELNTFQQKGHHGISLVAWSPNGSLIAFSTGDEKITLLDSNALNVFRSLTLEIGQVKCFAWSPDSSCIAVGSSDFSIYTYDIESMTLKSVLKGHNGSLLDLSWCKSNELLASASADETVRVWDSNSMRAVAVLEGHTNSVFAVEFSPSGNLLISRSNDHTYRFWSVKRWDVLTALNETAYLPRGGPAFHPTKPLLAIKGISDNEIGLWNVDEQQLLASNTAAGSRHYVNARVVLTGDTGVGKSALSLVLTGKDFAPTESTHSRKVWTLDSSQITLPIGITETREALLWDLAGQPGYRLIHQLYLTEVAVALVVFDARSEIDPFSGVRHWIRALRHAQGISDSSFPMKKLLVAARCDRGSLSVSRTRLHAVIEDMGFDGFVETSAKEGIGVAELLETVKASIDWKMLPKVSSNELFQSIKQFLFFVKRIGRVIASVEDLLNSYLDSDYAVDVEHNPVEEFETCIRLVESRGLIQRLSFGGLVLVQPELLDAYASSMIETAKQEPDGLGSIKEIDARDGEFFVPSEIRLKDKEQERLLCIATVENLIRHELAIRQDSNNGTFLVFPSQFTRNWEEAPNPTGEAIKYIFEGPVHNIYARLAVRLSHSGVFTRKDMWRNAATFAPSSGRGICGVHLNADDEGRAELIIFFDPQTTAEIKSQFDEFVSLHLKRHAVRETIDKQLIIECPKCHERLPPKPLQIRLQKDLKWITCPTCDHRVSISHAAQESDKWKAAVIARMDETADRKRELAAAVSVVQGKKRTDDFDVFISYNSVHKFEVLAIAQKLKDHGILPWIDLWELRPGLPWQKNIERVIDKIGSAAIMIGPHPLTPQQKDQLQGYRALRATKRELDEFRREMELQNLRLGPWQDLETEALIREFVRRRCPVIPIILSGVKGSPKLPAFLDAFTLVDFRKTDPDPLQMLLWGITGKKSQPTLL